jgi:CrcB protein
LTRDGPLWLVLAAVGGGAVLGAWSRWALAYWLNPRIAHLPLGTLTANLLGAYLIGIFIALFATHPTVPPAWRLLIVTGFLGGMTTFSTFSAESFALLQQGRHGAAVAHAALHLFGSLGATLAGYLSYRWLAH